MNEEKLLRELISKVEEMSFEVKTLKHQMDEVKDSTVFISDTGLNLVQRTAIACERNAEITEAILKQI